VLQWFALLLLCLAIVVTKVSGDGEGVYLAPMAFLISAIVSVLSVTAAILMEVRKFWPTAFRFRQRGGMRCCQIKFSY